MEERWLIDAIQQWIDDNWEEVVADAPDPEDADALDLFVDRVMGGVFLGDARYRRRPILTNEQLLRVLADQDPEILNVAPAAAERSGHVLDPKLPIRRFFASILIYKYWDDATNILREMLELIRLGEIDEFTSW